MMEKIMAEVDRVAARVSMAGAVGFVSGASLATYRGTPKLVTAMHVAGSFVLVGTACFGTERIANTVLKETSPLLPESTRLYTSHGFGGLTGGAIAGGLYQGWPVPGMMFFTPIMLAIAVAEQRYEEIRDEKLTEIKASLDAQTRRRNN